jgi:hypothetical protein
VGTAEDRRRTRLVDRTFQLGLAFRLFVGLAVFFAVGLAAVFAPSAYVLATKSDLKSIGPAATEFLILHKRIWFAWAITFVGVFGYALILSHRIAGPVHRINEVLRALLRDEVPSAVRFRKSDYFQPTTELLAQLLKKYGSPASNPQGTPPNAPPGRGDP